MQYSGNNLGLSRLPNHRRHDLYGPETRYAMARDLGVADEEARFLSDPGPQTLRPTIDTKKVQSRLPKFRQAKLVFKHSPPKAKHLKPYAQLMADKGLYPELANQDNEIW